MRCVIVDDNAEFLETARFLLEADGLSVVGLASSGADAVRQTAELQPDLTLVDIDLNGESGFDVAGRLEGAVIIMISTHSQEDFADLIAASPAAGFVPKSELSRKAICDVLAE
jgi:two-component system, NarL family, nitrate/nitrite response regulator NarL